MRVFQGGVILQKYMWISHEEQSICTPKSLSTVPRTGSQKASRTNEEMDTSTSSPSCPASTVSTSGQTGSVRASVEHGLRIRAVQPTRAVGAQRSQPAQVPCSCSCAIPACQVGHEQSTPSRPSGPRTFSISQRMTLDRASIRQYQPIGYDRLSGLVFARSIRSGSILYPRAVLEDLTGS